MKSNRNGLLQVALRYAELGYPVFPCIPCCKEPLTDHGCLDATTDPEQIETWWRERPNANADIATAGRLAPDLDEENTWLADRPEKFVDLAIAPLSLTPNAGRQCIYRQPAGRAWRNAAGGLAAHVDTRAEGAISWPRPRCWAAARQIAGPRG